MRCTSYKKLIKKVYLWSNSSKNVQNKTFLAAEDLCKIVKICADNLPCTFLCLPRALVAYIVCRTYGYNVDLRIGARWYSLKQFAAHAWIEYGGSVILGNRSDIDSFSVFNMENALYYIQDEHIKGSAF